MNKSDKTLQLVPAIDLKQGKCVRLRQGQMEEDTVFSDNPVEVAAKWVDAGATRLHLVDLDGAFAGKPRNSEVVHAICKAFPDLPVQIGGGIRNIEIARAYVDAGVTAVIIGTQAVKEPEFVSHLCRVLPGSVIVGLDARNGYVATDGWASETNVTAVELAKHFEGAGVSAIVYTDISRDGMMQGVNVDATATLARAISIPVVASGGVTDLSDIKRLVEVRDSGVRGVIIGRALYEGTLDLVEAQQFVDAMIENMNEKLSQKQ